MSIVMLAACHSNEFFKTNSLAELYQKVRNGKNLCEDSDGGESNDSDHPKNSRNNISLNFTMDASITLLQETEPEALNLLYFMGCLPGGLSKKQLAQVWSDADTEKLVELLDTLSLIQPDTEYKVCLTPFLFKYIE